MARKHLLWQLFPSYLIVTIAVLIAAGWYATNTFRDFYLEQTADVLKARTILIRGQILPLIEKQSYSEVDELCKQLGKESSTRITVILASGMVIGDTDEEPVNMVNHADRPEIIEAVKNGFGKSIRRSPTLGINMMYVAVKLRENDNPGFIRTALPVSGINETLNDIYSKVLFGVFVIVLCAAVLSMYISRRITSPIIEMEHIAHDFAEGRLDQRVPPYTAEFGALAKSLNQMARQLDERIKTITKQRNELEAILTSMSEGLIAVDSDRHIVNVNKAFSKLLNIEPQKAYGRNIEEVIRNVELLEFVRDTLDSTQPIESEMFLLAESERFFQLHGTSLSENVGKKTGAVIVLTDMTRMRRLENIRRDFVSNVSHELRTPVTSIQGFVEALREKDIKDPEQVKRYLNIIAKHSDRLNAIIEDLLSLSRLEQEGERREISFEKTKLKPVLEAAIELADTKAKEKEIKILLDCSDEIEAEINAVLLEQAVLNLIDNAIKYSPSQSVIKVTAKKIERQLSISVQDKGCGIEEHHLERIFERFYVVDKGRSRKLGGTGLGLAIVKHIAQVHNGFISVKSKPGEGSIFTIFLPAE
jgi:two-component system, OmpR family, phosphate regulon sensor histidine kinase PhoR